MKVYIDNDCKCHTSNDGTMREFDEEFEDDDKWHSGLLTEDDE